MQKKPRSPRHLLTPRKCWFCLQGHSSAAQFCDLCEMIAMPSRDNQNNDALSWWLFSFGEYADFYATQYPQPSQRTYLSGYAHAKAIFDLQDNCNVALRLGNAQERYLLVRYADGKRCFSSKRNGQEITKLDGFNAHDILAMEHYVQVNSQVESPAGVPGELNQFQPFLIYGLMVYRNFRMVFGVNLCTASLSRREYSTVLYVNLKLLHHGRHPHFFRCLRGNS